MFKAFSVILCLMFITACSSNEVQEPMAVVVPVTVAPHVESATSPGTLESRLIDELAKANGATLNAYHCEQAELTGNSKAGYTLKFFRNPGEETESCKARYGKDGALMNLECSYEFTAPAMGTENSRTVIKAQRFFDSAGLLTKVIGRYKETRLRDGKVMRERPLISINDETLGQLTKPLLRISEETLKLVRR